MKLKLDHIFILVEPAAEFADLLLSSGMEEGERSSHKGQGTSNRRFYFSNGMLEFLWVHDRDEANNGPGRKMRLYERSTNSDASPFGVILRRKEGAGQIMPFDGWTYQPDYFQSPKAFHIGNNSSHLQEPLCSICPL